MADLVLREKDGWIEVSEIQGALYIHEKEMLMDYLSRGDVPSASAVIDYRDTGIWLDRRQESLAESLGSKIGMLPITDIKAFYEPNPMLGQFLRIWVKVRKQSPEKSL